MSAHPKAVLFAGEKPFPVLPAIDHYAGAEKLVQKALQLQEDLAVEGAVFDITIDCEDGAKAGFEREQVEMAAHYVLSAENRFSRVAVRIHDVSHAHWQADLDVLVKTAGEKIAFITLPKPRSAAHVKAQIDYLRMREAAAHLAREIPVHVMIETLGALHEIWQIACLPSVESLDFGLMDFVSDHHGAIAGSAMKSPLQFEHPLLVRAKTELVSAALSNGVIPTHNVTTELKDEALIYADAKRARAEFAFLRMWSIHPNQIAPILKAMRPDFSEVAEAAEILTAAQDKNWAPISLNGTLHDRASYRYYWELLARAQATGAQIPEAVKGRFF